MEKAWCLRRGFQNESLIFTRDDSGQQGAGWANVGWFAGLILVLILTDCSSVGSSWGIGTVKQLVGNGVVDVARQWSNCFVWVKVRGKDRMCLWNRGVPLLDLAARRLLASSSIRLGANALRSLRTSIAKEQEWKI